MNGISVDDMAFNHKLNGQVIQNKKTTSPGKGPHTSDANE